MIQLCNCRECGLAMPHTKEYFTTVRGKHVNDTCRPCAAKRARERKNAANVKRYAEAKTKAKAGEELARARYYSVKVETTEPGTRVVRFGDSWKPTRSRTSAPSFFSQVSSLEYLR
jgi:hypothetical protein